MRPAIVPLVRYAVLICRMIRFNGSMNDAFNVERDICTKFIDARHQMRYGRLGRDRRRSGRR